VKQSGRIAAVPFTLRNLKEVVVRGSGRMKLDDEIVELNEWDVVRVPPGTWRGYEGGPEGLEILVFGAPNLGESPREDVEGQRDWWADERPMG
jgi:mannose-6-phosphate isomerase-like protein (cupin superfamily)